VTAAADIYSLGALLHLLVYGCHPSAAAVRSAVGAPLPEVERRASPREPELVPRAVKGDLAAIVRKALETQPHDRYGSVTAFADDLQRLLDHLPIRAGGASWNDIKRSMSSTTPPSCAEDVTRFT
jgi:serine/threonine-protein kinase